MGKIWDIEKFKLSARKAAAEGIVMLENKDEVLPLKKNEKIAVFGRAQMNYYKSGTGSGGMVNARYVVGIYEALENSKKFKLNKNVRKAYEEFVKENPFDVGFGWAAEPWFQKEMPLTDGFVKKAAAESDKAIFIIGRTAGEDQDNKATEGSYLLTKDEIASLKAVCNAFKQTIVLLNTGNIIDMKWVKQCKPSSVLYVWQGGQEGGNAVLDVLSGDVNPSGKLSDTIAYDIQDYASTRNFGSDKKNYQEEDIYVGYRYFETFEKEKVLYPFGYGMSYTSFDVALGDFAYDKKDGVSLEVLVTNTGARAGKEVVQIYCQAPLGKLGKASRVLCGFAKSDNLEPGQCQKMQFNIPGYWMASYDDGGVTGHKSSYVLEEGTYTIYAGSDVRSAKEAGEFKLDKLEVVLECEEAYAPVDKFKRLKAESGKKGVEKVYENVPLRTLDPNKKRNERLPKALKYTGDKGYKLVDVANNKVSLEKFIAQLSDHDLVTMMRGEGMCSPKVTAGIAGAYGGVTDALSDFGIPVGGCSDGPSGIRMDCGTHAFSLPNGTCLACTFDENINEELFGWEGLELRKFRIDALLGPGMNIHRSPLNGRNFEYFSEDPFLTGKLVSAQLRGLHKYGVTGVIKHFAGNTQETNRHNVNNVVSERALREIYLKGFEIAVREGNARAVMSTYGPVNGVWTASSYDLLTTILRGEWGFDGIVMTDWWAMGNDEANGKGSYSNVAAQVRAQNDLNMVNSSAEENSNKDNLDDAIEKGLVTRDELARCAGNILRFLLKTPAFEHLIGKESALDKELEAAMDEDDASLQEIIKVKFDKKELLLDTNLINTEKGETTVFLLSTPTKCEMEMEITLKAENQPDVAQLPLSIFQDRQLIQSITLLGMDRKFKTFHLKLAPSFLGNFYLKFYFAQTGLVIDSVKVIKTKEM